MNNWLKFTFNKVFLCALIILIIINIIGAVTEDALILKTAIPLCIPVFLIFFFIKYNTLGLTFVSFLMFSFLGDIAYVFFPEEVLIEASSILYIISYMYLLMMCPKFKILEFNTLIGVYLIVVFSIALYFLYIVHSILQTFVPNPKEVLLFGVKSLMLIILGFSSFAVYLNTQTRQSVLFLTAIIFFGLSVMLNYINLYFLYNWSFELLQNIFYTVALYLMFRYIINLNFTKKKSKQLHLENYSSDAVLS
ncbi:hypothetical protein QLS71_019150 [Mariniflexile litorale]|uniref:YhhN-like protein n=1 Tax=Mariniflexile litorale TaxID=3045158 RepID=A0AAU7EE27_9FLAO|nr:hypothetical protein [Mariniflexile sp. KMM 9835]MDQ8211678.1 hypothetical protein [Mariniflexile sp. KMM 9835]